MINNMTPLVKHIEYLLRRHDCVILPGLGALLVVHRPAVINESWAMAIPPVRTLCFNSAIHHNDGLLANSVARKECMSYAEALQTVESTIEDYRAALCADGELRLGRLGVLKMNDEESVCFSPFKQDTLRGFTNVPLPSLPETIEDKEKPLSTADNRYLYLRIPRQALKAAACLVLIVMAALSFVLPDTGTVKRDYASVLPLERLSTHTQHTEPTVVLPGDSSDVTSGKRIDTVRFFVVVGVFHNIKDCELFISQHPSWASRMQILGSGKNNCKVVVDASAERQSLAERMRTTPEGAGIRAEFPQAWIWERK